MDYKKSIDFFNKYITEDYEAYIGKSLGGKKLETLEAYKEYFFGIHEILSQILDYLEENKDEIKDTDLNKYINLNKELLVKLEHINHEIDVLIENKKKEKISSKKIKIDKDILDILSKNDGFSDDFKNKIKKFRDKELNETELNYFLDLFTNEIIINVENSKGEIVKANIKDTLINKLIANAKIDKFKKELKVLIEKPYLSSFDIKYLKNKLLRELCMEDVKALTTTTPKVVSSSSVSTVVKPKDTKIVSKPPKKKKTEESKPEEYNMDYNEIDATISFPVTINELVSRGYIPSVLGAKKISDICMKLGFKIKSLNTKINKEQFVRLYNDKEINQARIYRDFMDRHNQKIAEYDRLIHNYKVLLNSKMRTGYFTDEYINRIKNIINSLEEQRNEYKGKISKIKFDDVDSYYNIEMGSSNKSNRVADKSEKTNSELRGKYLELETYRKEQKKATSKKMKQLVEKRIIKTQREIKKLQEKEVRLNSKQVEIINKNSEKYIQRMERKQLSYNIDQTVILDISDRLVETGKELKNNTTEQNNLKKDILVASGREKRSLERELKQLEKMEKGLEKERQRLEKQEERLYNSSGLRR